MQRRTDFRAPSSAYLLCEATVVADGVIPLQLNANAAANANIAAAYPAVVNAANTLSAPAAANVSNAANNNVQAVQQEELAQLD